jgi:hypothetical protein
MIFKRTLEHIFNNRLGRFKRTYYFSNFKQKIYETPNLISIISVKNKVITEESLRQFFSDGYQFENIDLDPTIQYFESQTNSKIVLNSRGLLACKKIKQVNNIHYILAYSLTSLNQLRKFNSDPYINIKEFETLYDQLSKIQFEHKSFCAILNIDFENYGHIYFNSSTSKRILRISNIVDMPNILTSNEFKTIKNLQKITVRKDISNMTFDEMISLKKPDKSFNIDSLFTVSLTNFFIKLMGITSMKYESLTKHQILRNNYICLNYIKNIGKLDELITNLEYNKIKNL